MFRVVADSKDLTPLVSGLSFSAVDPGGFEACSFSLPADLVLRKGARLQVQDGLTVVWDGRVGECERTIAGGDVQTTLAGEGYGAALKDNTYSMIYVDRDLTQWQGPSVQRQLDDLGAAGGTRYVPSGASAEPDASTGNPGLKLSNPSIWAAGQTPSCEAFYNGRGITLAKVYYSVVYGAGNGNTQFTTVYLCATDRIGASDSSSFFTANKTAYLTSAAGRSFSAIIFQGTGGAAGTGASGANDNAYAQLLAVYGNHGLTGRGPDPVGFYPSDIATDALARSNQADGPVIVPGQIDQATAFIVPHYVQYTPVAHQQVIDDMAKLMGWHWGVWEPWTALDGPPRLDFRAPPTTATAHVRHADCTDLTIADRLSGYYDSAEITWTDPAGVQGVVTVTANVPELQDAGIHRTLSLDLGTGSAAAATAFGTFVLALTNRAARAAGSATLPNTVTLANGAQKPAYLLRPGLDRIRILDLPNPQRSLTDPAGPDTFRVKRAETAVDNTGAAKTTVEFDDGANLIEVIQARLQLAAKLAGQ